MPTGQSNFAGLHVASFESRRVTDMERMLTRAGAVASVSPSMREVPLAENHEVITYGHRLIAGEFEIPRTTFSVGVEE